MIETIVHLADIHVRKSPTRHDEYGEVFDRTYKSIKQKKPDRIVIVGDLYHDYIDLQPEASIMIGDFLKELAKIAPVRITRGNHDIRKKALKRIDSIEAIVRNIDNPNIIYYNETGFFDDENVTWAVWKHGEKKNNPWGKKKKPDSSQTVIDLFHDPINGCVTPNGFEMKKKTYNSIDHFKGDYSMFGDIHKKQFFKDNTKAYCGSLIAQTFAEGDYEFHGYLLWNIKTGDCEEVEIKNDYSFRTLTVNAFTDFEDLELEIENPTKYNRVRVYWNTLPDTYNDTNKRAVNKYLNDNYNIISLTHEKNFVEDEDVIVEEDIDVTSISDPQVQHDIFESYLNKIGVEDEIIDEIIKLDDEITSRIEVEELTNIQWSIIKFSGKNFMSYKDIEIDWRDMEGLFQITGINTAGKTTVMKLITYILYNKTKETEKTMKFGDVRYVNNRIDVDECEGFIVIDVNGEYFGIKRKTIVEKKRDGEIKGSPTTVEYYKLNSPDDDIDEDNIIENLVEDERVSTQKKLERAIGSYDNFSRIAMTTSDNLNEILSSDKSVFVDSLLHDSGLDLFDHKLSAFKEYMKEFSSVPRVSCNIENTEEKIEELLKTNEIVGHEIKEIETNKIPAIDESISKGKKYVETLITKLNKIDDEIYQLDVNKTNDEILVFEKNIDDLNIKYKNLSDSISKLKDSYDENRLTELDQKREMHKDNVYSLKVNIKEKEREIDNVKNEKGFVSGDIVRLKEKGAKLKSEIATMKKSKNCPTCGQLLDESHRHKIDDQVKSLENDMFNIAKEIRKKESTLPEYDEKIKSLKNDITKIESEIDSLDVKMEKVLEEIGLIIHDKNEVERRNQLVMQQEAIPTKIENNELQKKNLEQKIKLYNNTIDQINENKKINVQIVKAKEKLGTYETDRDNLKDDVRNKKNLISQNIISIKEMEELIVKFKNQEIQDKIHDVYKKCIHRDGIPTQLLKTYAIPKINKELDDLLKDVEFNVWLDEDDLKLKLAYNNNLNAVIDALSGSGKERTFASVILKFALNQINMKSKPDIFLLDEVMGKLTDDSVDEFIQILHIISSKLNKVLIVEHNHEINPDYLINVTKDENDISSLEIE